MFVYHWNGNVFVTELLDYDCSFMIGRLVSQIQEVFGHNFFGLEVIVALTSKSR